MKIVSPHWKPWVDVVLKPNTPQYVHLENNAILMGVYVGATGKRTIYMILVGGTGNVGAESMFTQPDELTVSTSTNQLNLTYTGPVIAGRHMFLFPLTDSKITVNS